jgi:hypothetical protein
MKFRTYVWISILVYEIPYLCRYEILYLCMKFRTLIWNFLTPGTKLEINLSVVRISPPDVVFVVEAVAEDVPEAEKVDNFYNFYIFYFPAN